MSSFARATTRRTEAGFVLLEIMLAVVIFAFGVAALGRAMTDCLNAQRLRMDLERVRLVLGNRMLEIQANPAMPDDFRKTELKGAFKGLTLIEKRVPLQLRNEEGAVLGGLNEVQLTIEWPADGGSTQNRTLSFYLARGS